MQSYGTKTADSRNLKQYSKPIDRFFNLNNHNKLREIVEY